MTRIFVDSTCDLPKGFAKDHGIVTLPLHVVVEGAAYVDGVTITAGQVYRLMRSGAMPTTAQVSAAQAVEAMEASLKDGEDIICIAFSSKMSGTWLLLKSVARELSEKYPCRRVAVVDALGGSFATGLIAMRAARLAQSGGSFDEILALCDFCRRHVEHVFCITDLNWMVRGGRISRAAGCTANLLGIKPVLDVADGQMRVIHRVRGRFQAMERVADIVAGKAAACQLIGITHADDEPAARRMAGLIKSRLPDCDCAIEPIGAVLAVHIGIGGVGVFFLNKLPD